MVFMMAQYSKVLFAASEWLRKSISSDFFFLPIKIMSSAAMSYYIVEMIVKFFELPHNLFHVFTTYVKQEKKCHRHGSRTVS
jgi:hypothetical protein